MIKIYISPETLKEDKAIKITEVFLETEFEGGRHERRVNKIDR